jgi:hypothetical protein
MTMVLLAAAISVLFIENIPHSHALAAPTIKLNPTSGPGDTPVTVTGSGWRPGRVIDIRIGTSGPSIATPTVASDGTFSTTITIPSDATGQLTISADDAGVTATATFTVTPIPVPVPTPAPETIPSPSLPSGWCTLKLHPYITGTVFKLTEFWLHHFWVTLRFTHPDYTGWVLNGKAYILFYVGGNVFDKVKVTPWPNHINDWPVSEKFAFRHILNFNNAARWFFVYQC